MVALSELAERAAAPDLGDPVPAIAGQQRHRVITTSARPVGRRWAPIRPGAPVVDDQLARSTRAASAREGREPVHRVVECRSVSPRRHVDRAPAHRSGTAASPRRGSGCRGSRRSASPPPHPPVEDPTRRPALPLFDRRHRGNHRVRADGLEATEQAAGAGDPRPAAGDVRAAGQRAARAPDRRADQDRALPAHQRPQPRPRLRRAARALPRLGGGARRAGRTSSRRRSGPAAWRKQKAPRIQAILEQLGEPPDLDWTETAPREESLEFLLALPGVGRKTAACVLIFTWGIPEIPVDVHVHRVGGRLGLFPPRPPSRRAHDEMLAIVDPEDAYELHMNLIRHGRERLPPETALRRVRAAPDVPLVPRDRDRAAAAGSSMRAAK